MKRISGFTCAVILAGAPVWALGATLKVPGTYPSIQAAVDAAVAGDVIQISSGTYVENVVVNSKQDLTIKAKKGAVVILDAGGAGPALEVLLGTNVLVQHLRVQNSTDNGVVVFNSTNCRIIGCRVRDFDQNGIWLQGTEKCQVRNCTVIEVGVNGIQVMDSSHCLVRDNTVKDVLQHGIQVDGLLAAIEENRITNATKNGIQLGSAVGGPCEDALVAGNIVKNCDVGISVDEKSLGNTLADNRVSKAVNGVRVGPDSDYNAVHANAVTSMSYGGIMMGGSDCSVTKNKVKKAAGEGFGVLTEATYCTFRLNRCTQAAMYGFFVYGKGGLFLENKATDSVLFDLSDVSVPAGTNWYVDNVFGTTYP